MTVRPCVLAIAVEDYPRNSVVASPLHGTIQNANKFVETVRAHLDIPEQNILFCSSRDHALKTHKACRQGIEAAVSVLLERFANQVGHLFIYLSGHGLSTGLGSTDDSYLLCEDFVDETSSLAAVSIDEITTILARGLGAGEHFIFVDACRSQSYLRAQPLEIAPFPAPTGIAKRFIVQSASNQGVARLDEIFVNCLINSLSGNLSADADKKNPGQSWITFDSLRSDLQKEFELHHRSLFVKTIGASDGRIRPVPPSRPVKTIRDRSQRKAPPVELLQFFDEIAFLGETNSQLAGLQRDQQWRLLEGKQNFLQQAFQLREGRKWKRLEIFSIDDLSTAGRLGVSLDQLEQERQEAEQYLQENAHRLADSVRLFRYEDAGFYGSMWLSDTGQRRAHLSHKQAGYDIRFASAVDYVDYNISRLREIDDCAKKIEKIRSLPTTSLLFEYSSGSAQNILKSSDGQIDRSENSRSKTNGLKTRKKATNTSMTMLDSNTTILARVVRALDNKAPSQFIGSKRAIIGPAASVLGENADRARDALIRGERPDPQQMSALQYAIRMTRPSLYCHPTEENPLPEDGSWLKQEWPHFQSVLSSAQRSVARIDKVIEPNRHLQGRISIGTGFLVAPGTLMTAKHVIRQLASEGGTFRGGSAMVDFCGYFGVPGIFQFQVTEISAVDPDHDLGLLKIESTSSELNQLPLLLDSICDPQVESPVCVVGYPQRDSRNPEVFMSLLFEQNFGCKRAAIGEALQCLESTFSHDCSTLGGNSGSPIFDIARREFCGVHVAGELWSENEAVTASKAKAFLDKVRSKKFVSLVPVFSKQESRSMSSKPDRFRQYLSNLKASDPAIANELEGTMRTESAASGIGGGMREEAIILTQGRPVLDITNNQVVINIQEVQSQVWRDRLKNAIPLFRPIIPAVGRIEVANFPGAEWLGTGWLVRDNIIVTNRHVASAFAELQGGQFRFIPDIDGNPTKVSIDFVEEFASSSSLNFPLFKIVHIEKSSGPDIAFLRIEPVVGQDLPAPIPIDSTSVSSGEQVAIVGYPARDPYFPDPKTMDRIFGARYDKKRLAPGLVQEVTSTRLFHDCTTLGGNSGSVIVSIQSGKAVALHFAGTMFSKNHAVPIAIVHETLDAVLRKTPGGGPVPRSHENIPSDDIGTPASSAQNASIGARVIEATIPIKIRVEIGDALGAIGITQTTASSPQTGSSQTQPASPSMQSPRIVDIDADDDMIATTEAKVSDYADRKGYQAGFIGEDFEVPLPVLVDNEDDAFEFAGSTELKYKNFSVVMSKSRRMCRFSACNIDGSRSKKTTRPGWQFDPRVPKEFQIMKECYGNPPKFSRGHMTRREDPAWGTQAEAQLGNADSMHVTNSVPQMQPFNAGIWLALEDYALQNTRKDKMKICVFTGPFLGRNDPFRFKVKVPITFWKVLAFIHDETGDLCATGYTMSQKSFLEDDQEEFVFGRHQNAQVPIHVIEQRAGISFGPLREFDPKNNESLAAEQTLSQLSQIRFF